MYLVATGTPSSTPAWPRFPATGDFALELGTTPVVLTGVRTADCDFIDSLSPRPRDAARMKRLFNHAELDRLQDEVDRDLAMAQERADNLAEFRREADWLELKLQNGLQELPELANEWKELDAKPLPIIAPRPPVVLPPPSVFEGSTGERKRARVRASEARLKLLEKVLDGTTETRARNERQ